MFIETVRYRLLYHIPVPPPNKRCLCYIFGTSLNRQGSTNVQRASTDLVSGRKFAPMWNEAADRTEKIKGFLV